MEKLRLSDVPYKVASDLQLKFMSQKIKHVQENIYLELFKGNTWISRLSYFS